jgi:hypothetical protein
VDEQQGQLDDPKEEVGAHVPGGDPATRRKRVRDVVVRRCDGAQHDGDALCSVGALDAEPEHGEDGTGADAEVTEVIAKGPSGDDREGDVELGTNGTVQDHRDGNAGGADDHDGQGLAPAQAKGQNARCSLPGAQVDCVGGPVGHDAPDGPVLVLYRRRVHVMIGLGSVCQGQTQNPDDKVSRQIVTRRASKHTQTCGGARAPVSLGSSHA